MTIPFFCSATLLSCSEAFPSCSDVRLSCSEIVFNCSERTPFWYSRSYALDSARVRSHRYLSTFFSISFTASFSFSFSSARGSILRISPCRCSVVRAMLCTNINDYGGPHPSMPKINSASVMLTLIWFMAVVRMDRSLFTSRGGVFFLHDHYLRPTFAEDSNTLRLCFLTLDFFDFVFLLCGGLRSLGIRWLHRAADHSMRGFRVRRLFF